VTSSPPIPSVSIPSGLGARRTDAERIAVSAYFEAVERIQPKKSGSPETVALQLVAGLGTGDTAEFDGMIRQIQETRNGLAGITPPQPCAALHRGSLANLDAGLALMRAMKKAMSSSDPLSGTLDLANRANALKAHAEALQAQERALKLRYRE
jgi:hypothetical protein